MKRREAAVWQRRFWEHALRDEGDLNRQIDYIHYISPKGGNPVKHGLVKKSGDWPWSSFHRYVKEGLYDPGLGEGVNDRIKEMEGVE